MSATRILTTAIFAVIAVVQALRFFQAWPVSINGYEVPVWASAIAALACAALAVLNWREGKRP